MTPIIIVAVVWVACGVLAYGLTLGFWFRIEAWPRTVEERREGFKIALVGLLIGPFGLAGVAHGLGGEIFQHGLMWRLPKEGNG